MIAALSQRGASIAGMFGAGSLSMVAVLAIVLNVQRPHATLLVYAVAMMPPVAMFVGCVFWAHVAGPGTFRPAGSAQITWKGNKKAAGLPEALIGMLNSYQAYIVENDTVISRHAAQFCRGLIIGPTSVPLLMGVGVVHACFPGARRL